MTSRINHQIRLAGRPVGFPKRSDWQFTEGPIPEPRDGEVLTQVLYLSLDPAMRGWMNEGKSYIGAVGIGEVMRVSGVGKVVASKHPKFDANDYVSGVFGVQEYVALEGAQLTKIDPSLAPLPTFLDTLKSREDIVEGLETFPETLLKLFSGENFGKLVLKIADA
jgi:NADPH-dependent curcumin reductase